MSQEEIKRPDPEELLAKVMKAERKSRHGYHKIFLGFAAGVGKTYEMLAEANRRRSRGEEVVIGYVETHGREGTQKQIGDLEIIPRKVVEYRGTTFEEMDTDAILARHPQLVIVDELAHTNVPGSERAKRWKDVEVLLDAGISVLSTLNVQHLESLNDTIHDITGVWVRETVPDRILQEANEVMMIDIPPQALINRLERGDVYPAEKVNHAMRNFFREGNLNALREIALRETAHEVDTQLSTYRKDNRIEETWAAHDRIMVCISPSRSSMRLIRRGWRIAQRLKGDIVAVYVECRPPGTEERNILSNDLELANRLNIPVVNLHGDVAEELIRYAKEKEITQMVMGHSRSTRWQEFLHGSIIHEVARQLRKIDILIVASEE